MRRTLRLEVSSMWDLLPEVRQRVTHHLFDVSADAQDAAVMCASELAENAIKYGRSVPEQSLSMLDVVADGSTLRLTVKSGVIEKRLAQNTMERVKSIKHASDKFALYVDRMKEIAKDPQASSTQLGLYRICVEGGFELDCQLQGNVLEITATRSLQ